jgi:FkbM family methyltransferase
MPELSQFVRLAGLLAQGAGGRRRARRLVGLFLIRGQADTLAFRRDGVRWTIPVSDRIVSSNLFETGGFQRSEFDAVVRWLENHGRGPASMDVIVDIGANIGTTTIPFALERGWRVLALEPDPSNFEFLQTNVNANHVDALVTCLQVAVSDHPGLVKMVVDSASAGSTEIVEPGMPVAGAVIEANARRLDDILRELSLPPSRIALVWSDTEGFERHVIESGASLWSAGTPLYIEVWPPGLRRHGGIAELAITVGEHFETMIPSADLVRSGTLATPRPAGTLQEFMKTQPSQGTDVLLLPKRISGSSAPT